MEKLNFWPLQPVDFLHRQEWNKLVFSKIKPEGCNLFSVDIQIKLFQFISITEKANITPIYKKGQGGHGELKAVRPHLCPWEEDGADNPRNHFQVHEGQENHHW